MNTLTQMCHLSCCRVYSGS